MGTVSYTISSSTGEQHFEGVPVGVALEDIRHKVKEESKWFFLDGDHKTPSNLTEEDLLKGTILILTDTLMGG